ncbi:hypothetical protein MUK42_37221 [Musa troglodytarum]|uniref:Uncharacterized protein n=1 Tax=Musa troglodytarum TaxID=320322 RepID=A0A9E7JV42_9LILI|nr:hypothetical protein MUK42_37221 [Musa troglodytarum]
MRELSTCHEHHRPRNEYPLAAPTRSECVPLATRLCRPRSGVRWPLAIKQATTCLLNCRNSSSTMVTRRIQRRKAHSRAPLVSSANRKASHLSEDKVRRRGACQRRHPTCCRSSTGAATSERARESMGNAGFVELLPCRFQSNVGYPDKGLFIHLSISKPE